MYDEFGHCSIKITGRTAQRRGVDSHRQQAGSRSSQTNDIKKMNQLINLW
jgi:hypothetical protein